MAQRAFSKNVNVSTDGVAFTKNPDKAVIVYQRSKNATTVLGQTKNVDAGVGVYVTASKNN
jgi:hypothetical protein